MADVTVEFFGIPRQRAGRPELVVEAETAADALTAVVRACPGLTGLLSPDGTLSPHFLLSVNGHRFHKDLDQPLVTDDRLLILSADAGG